MLTLRLDVVEDADLIEWIDSQPEGARSAAIRQALRAGLGYVSHSDALIDLDAIRDVVAEELAKVLTGQIIAPSEVPPDPHIENGEFEARYGSKLDQMMGGLFRAKSSDDNKDV